MNVKYSSSIGKALRFAFMPKRWLPFFILDGAFALLLLSYASSLLPLLFGMQNPLSFSQLLGTAAPALALAILWGLGRVWLIASLIRQSWKEKEYSKSFRISPEKYLHVLAAIVIVAIISSLVSLVPLIGWILSIIVSLMFLFALQGIVIKDKGPVESLKDSYAIFRKNTLDVFLIWLIISIISIVIAGAFMFPAMAFALGLLSPSIHAAAGATDTSSLAALLEPLFQNLPLLAALGAVMLAGLSITQVFGIKAQTEFYLQFRKARR